MNNFINFVTPEQAKALDDQTKGGRRKPLSYYKRRAKDHRFCFICESEKIWRFGDTDLCFSCTTGEADASDDYEIFEA